LSIVKFSFFFLSIFLFPILQVAFYVYKIYARLSQPRLSTADHALSCVEYTITAV
jgi:hypothetical protein